MKTFLDTRKGITRLIKLVQEDKVSRVFINYKDRLTRFGFNYLQLICDFHKTEIVVVSTETEDKTMSEELAEDIISIIHSFSGKLYWKKTLRKRKVNLFYYFSREGGKDYVNRTGRDS